MVVLVNKQVMNMLHLMVKLPYTYLLISSLFFSVHGRGTGKSVHTFYLLI